MKGRRTGGENRRGRSLPEIGTLMSGTVSKIVPGGDGLIREGGRVIFVPFVLPGETVSVRITGGGKDFLRGEPEYIGTLSGSRHTPPCPLFTRCGGCNFQHIAYAEQLAVKRTFVREAFERTGGMTIDLPPIVPSVPLYYRNRVQIHRRADGRLGFMRRDSNEIIEVGHCYISVPPINRLFESPPETAPSRFVVFAWDEDYRSTAGNGNGENVTITVAGKAVTFNPGGFFQSNLGMLEKFVPDLVETALRAAGKRRELLLDLYAGAGLFGSFLAGHFGKIVSVEQNAESIEAARMNVGGKPHEFFAADVDEWIVKNASKVPDLAVVDPPRTGLSAPVRSYLTGAGIPAVLYVSCDPVTLARDAAELVRGGFALSSLTLYDFYPQTSHVESLAVFLRSPR